MFILNKLSTLDSCYFKGARDIDPELKRMECFIFCAL